MKKMDVQSVSLRKSTSRIQQLEHRNIENMITHLEHAVWRANCGLMF
jgi:hypothetical protein